MEKDKRKYSRKDIDAAMNTGWSLWSFPAYFYISKKFAYFVANKTRLTPNQLTILGFLISLGSAFCFLQGRWTYLVWGAVLFFLSFLFDCIDGTVARLKNSKSAFGAYLDGMLDQVRMFLLVFCLVWGQYVFTKDVAFLAFGMAYIFIYIMQWMSKQLIKENKQENFLESGYISESHNNRFKFFWKTKELLQKKNIAIMPGFMEADALVFILGPVFLQIKLGIILASIIVMADIFLLQYISFKRNK